MSATTDVLFQLSGGISRPWSVACPFRTNSCCLPILSEPARKRGLDAEVCQLPLSQLSNDDLPAVLLLTDDQSCIVYQMTDEKLHLGNEMGERIEVAINEIEPRFTSYLITVSHSKTNRTATDKGWLLSALEPFWKTYRDVLIASLLVNIFALASPLFVMNVYDRVVPNQAYETLWVLATGVLLAYLFDFFIKVIRARLVDLAGKRVDQQLSATLMEKVLGLKLAARPANTGSFMNNLPSSTAFVTLLIRRRF